MGSVIRRGTRDNPRYFIKYREADGTQRMKLSKQPTKELAKQYLANVEARIQRGLVGIPEVEVEELVGNLLDDWTAILRNRNADDDRGRVERHLRPAWGKKRLSEITLAAVMTWLDTQRGKGKLSEPSIRHNLNLLSRFFSWAIERGKATINPVRQIPMGRRPKQSARQDQPWLDDDDVVRKLINALPSPFDLMFYLGNQSGLRPGESAGLRLSDLASLDDGVIRVRFSYDGPLKEDKDGSGKVKWAPAPADAADVFGSWIARREAMGAGPEDLVFPAPPARGDKGAGARPYRKEQIEDAWDASAAAHVGEREDAVVTRHGRKSETKKPALTFYQATRHSFVSRNLSKGVALDEVSAAVGHSSPVVTRRFYDHFVRKSFSTEMRTGLGLKRLDKDAEVIQFRAAGRKK